MQLQNNTVIVAAVYVAAIGVAGFASGVTSAAAWVSVVCPRTPARLLDVDRLESAVAGPVSSSSGGAAMSAPMAAVVDSDADARWLEWKARGAVRDRRSGLIMGGLFALALIVAVGWLVARLRLRAPECCSILRLIP